MIVITGAAGFIGSSLLSYFNQIEADTQVCIVDKFSIREKDRNFQSKNWISGVDREAFFGFLEENHHKITFIFHLGARTDTAETDTEIFDRLNLGYSKKVWNACVEYSIPLIYASSAATYGGGEYAYIDDHSIIEKLEPLNAYGNSKNDFDKWVLKQEKKPPFWAGLKFFNVYGPNEYHKGRMASVIFHAFNQIMNTDEMKLFRSHHPDWKDGAQSRDFIYVKDVVSVCYFLYQNQSSVDSGIYNVGSGKARTFLDLSKAVFSALNKKEKISFIDTPEDIREKYQYYTCANMEKLKDAGYNTSFFRLEEGVLDYVKNYLLSKKYN